MYLDFYNLNNELMAKKIIPKTAFRRISKAKEMTGVICAVLVESVVSQFVEGPILRRRGSQKKKISPISFKQKLHLM